MNQTSLIWAERVIQEKVVNPRGRNTARPDHVRSGWSARSQYSLESEDDHPRGYRIRDLWPEINVNRIAILSDFDGTLTDANVLASLYREFGTAICQTAGEFWSRGDLSTRDELAICFGTFNTERAEMEAYLRSFRLDPAFFGLLEICSRSGWEFAIVSDGLRWYIDFILERNGCSGIPVFANGIEFTQDGFSFSFPHFDPSTPMRGVSKSKIVRSYQSSGYKVIFIGDGLSDTDALLAADVVYAMDDLREFAGKEKIGVIGVNNLAEVVESLAKVGRG